MYKESRTLVENEIKKIKSVNNGKEIIGIQDVVDYVKKEKKLDDIEISEIDMEASLDVDGIASGLSYIEDEIGYIFVDEEEPPYRKRFTVLHELGHILLHHKTEKSPIISFRDEIIDTGIISYNKNKLQEYEANLFAANILMPKNKIKELLLNDYSILDIANILGVSVQALQIRLNEMRRDQYVR